jgi:hypothetical protein
MKTAVRNVIGDLVEKRLWPVAVALIACIVVAPLVLARGGAPAPSTGNGAGIAPGAGADHAAAVELAEPGSGDRDRAGRVRNPFGTAADAAAASTPAQTPAAAAASSPSSAPAAAASPSGASSSGGSASGAGTPAVVADSTASTGTTAPAVASAPATSPTTSKTTTTKSGTSATYSVAVRFGRTDGNRHTLRDVARLTALPNAEAPVVSLLGVLRDGRTAVLRVASNATASGNGTCKPSASRCTTVELKAGDAEYFRVAVTGSDVVAWYYLKLLHVDRHATTSEKVAKAAYARRSAAGMAVVREDAASVRSYRYLPGLGVLVRAKRRITASAAKAGDRAAEPLLPADEQDGLPVWRSVPRPAKR